MRRPITLSSEQAREIWVHAQGLDTTSPFGAGSGAVATVIARLGYVQIDTINVIERCHHHILYNRISDYERAHLHTAQTVDKTVFEYWTHALSYVPVSDLRFFVADMKRHRKQPERWNADIKRAEVLKILKRIRDDGPLTISDIKDDVLQDKDHPWASRKPSKRALQRAFFNGEVVISARSGMLKTYELTERHFGWDKLPAPATELQTLNYLLDRAIRSQGVISLDSVCFHNAQAKKMMLELIERRERSGKLKPVQISGLEKTRFWMQPEALEARPDDLTRLHILSPFDPLIIQRKRTEQFFGYAHLFEAYVPKEKRVMGYFTLPVMLGTQIVAALDLKADRQNRALLIQAWHWVGKGNEADHRQAIEVALADFERFQLAN